MQTGVDTADRRPIETAVAPRVPADLRLFFAMLAVLVPARIAHTAQIRTMYTDGVYHLEVARHVRDGHGLVSNVSLYHFGYETFPYPTSVDPLWPVLLGLGGRVVDIAILAHWLPLLLSFCAVGAAFLFGRRLWPEPLFPEHVPGLHAGHLFALGLAVQADFVFFSSLPCTEPLAWTLVFLFCLRVVRKGADLDWPWAIEIGVWLGLLYFARFQLLVAPIAMAGAYAIRFALGPGRARIAAHGAVALGVASILVGAWFLRLRTFVLDPGLSSLLRFDQNRANDLLSPIDVIVDSPGILATLLDRAYGFLVAWDPASGSSYQGPFHTLHWALAAAAPLAAIAAFRAVRRDGWPMTVERLRSPDLAHAWFLGLFALGALLSVHAVHKHFDGQWYFSNRQGMVSLLAFLLALGWLLRQRRPLPRVLGVLVLCSTFALGVRGIWVQVSDPGEELRQDEDYAPLLAWFEAHRPAEGKLIVALDSQVQRVAWRTDDIGYHWVFSGTPYADFLTLTDRLGVRYVVFRKKGLDRSWRFASDGKRLNRDFAKVADAPDTHVIYERRR